jgi:hypothetical protein
MKTAVACEPIFGMGWVAEENKTVAVSIPNIGPLGSDMESISLLPFRKNMTVFQVYSENSEA